MRKGRLFMLSLFTLALAMALGGMFVSQAAADEFEVTEYQVTASTAWETTPTLGNDGTTDLVVFTNRTVLESGALGPGDIWYQRLVDGAPIGPAVQVTSGDRDDELNDVSGDYIVYTSYDSTASPSGNITLYQISTGVSHSIRKALVIHEVRIHGRLVVWREGGYMATQVMLYDLAWLGQGFEPVVLAGPVPPTFGAEIGDRLVVWSEFVDGQYDIRAYDLETFLHMDVTNTANTNEGVTYTRTSGPWVVWHAQDHGTSTRRIEALNMDTAEFRIIADNDVGNYRPSINDDLIVYESDLAGNLDIYVYRLSTSETFQVITDPNDQYVNDVFDNLVAYVDQRHGNEDIYVTTLAFNEPPIADANGPYTGTEGVPVTFDASGSYDPDGTVISYTWDFGDENLTTLVDPTITHTYAQNGTYTVTLAVTDNSGESATDTTTATIDDTRPRAAFSATPRTGDSILTVTFTDRSTSYDGIVSWSWTFGDGATSTEQNPTHSYTTLGTYTVSLRVQEADGRTHTLTWLSCITVVDTTPPTLTAPDPLTVEATTPDGVEATDPILTSWLASVTAVDTIDPAPVVTHDAPTVFPLGETYVTFTATDFSGNTAAAISTVTVVDTTLPTVDIAAPADGTITASPAITVEGTATEAVGLDHVLVYTPSWEGLATTTGTTPTYSFTLEVPLVEGTNTITVNASDTSGNIGSSSIGVTRLFALTLATDPPDVTILSGEGWYDAGAYATISTDQYVYIAPDTRYSFTGWTTADMSGITNPVSTTTTVLMDTDKTVTANYVTQFYLTVTSPYDTPGGEGWYDQDETAYAILLVDIETVDDTVYGFTGWTGDATGWNLISDPILMDAPKTATANWEATTAYGDSDVMASGFWKLQVNVWYFTEYQDVTGIKLRGVGHAEVSKEELLAWLCFVDSNSDYFNGKIVNDNDLDGTITDLEILENAYDIMKTPRGSNSMKARAEQQLLMLWLNLARNAFFWNTQLDQDTQYIYHQYTFDDTDGLATIGEAILFCESQLINPDSDYEAAKDICDSINNNLGIIW